MKTGRRVVVGDDASGASTVLSDERVPVEELAPRGNQLALLWGTDQAGSLSRRAELAPYLPGPGGWRVSVLTIEPDSAPLLPAGTGVVLPDLAAAMARGGGRGMHATDTVDVVIVLSGSVGLEIDDGSVVVLEAGDTVVQLGARHAWRNPTDQAAVLAVVMVGAECD